MHNGSTPGRRSQCKCLLLYLLLSLLCIFLSARWINTSEEVFFNFFFCCLLATVFNVKKHYVYCLNCWKTVVVVFFIVVFIALCTMDQHLRGRVSVSLYHCLCCLYRCLYCFYGRLYCLFCCQYCLHCSLFFFHCWVYSWVKNMSAPRRRSQCNSLLLFILSMSSLLLSSWSLLLSLLSFLLSWLSFLLSLLSFLGSGPEGADDLCFHTGEISPSPPYPPPPLSALRPKFQPGGLNLSLKTQI